MRKLIKYLLLSILFLFVSLNIFFISTGRTFIYKAVSSTYFRGQSGPGIHDDDVFYNRSIEKGQNTFKWNLHGDYGSIRLSKDKEAYFRSLGTSSFLVIKNDQLLFEKYWNHCSVKRRTNSFSMAKSFVSLLIGIAIDEEKIKSVNQPISDFIPSFKEGKKAQITIKNVLNMSSGLNWVESGSSPLSHVAEGYYGSNLETLISSLEVEESPGTTFEYQSGDTQILAIILTKATGMSLSEYASEKIWKKIGAESDAFWSLDDQDGLEKAFCCIYSTPRDFAKIGKLVLNKGNWEGESLISENYINSMTKSSGLPDKESGKFNENYGFQWWLNNYNGKSLHYARGILGQYIIIVPEDELIIVRTGHLRDIKDDRDHPIDLYVYLDAAYQMLK